jgi:hypothetical protein
MSKENALMGRNNMLLGLVIVIVLLVLAFVIFSGGPATRDAGSPNAASPPAGSSTAPAASTHTQ